MKKFTITLDFEVSENWIEDGFDPTSDIRKRELTAFIEEEMLPHALPGSEVNVTKLTVIKK